MPLGRKRLDTRESKQLADTDPGLAEELGVRFARGLVSAWPEGNLEEATVRSDVRLGVGEQDGETYLCIGFGASELWIGWDGSEEEAAEAVDAEARRLADDLEGDRWMHGGGWREWRS